MGFRLLLPASALSAKAEARTLVLTEVNLDHRIFGCESVFANHCQPTCLETPTVLGTSYLEDHYFDIDASRGYDWFPLCLQYLKLATIGWPTANALDR